MAHSAEIISKFIPVLDRILCGKYNLCQKPSKRSIAMKSPLKRILPILLVIVTICSIAWYLFVYDTAFTKDVLLDQARFFEQHGHHSVAAWLYSTAYRQSGNNSDVAIELAEQFKANNNYSKAEYTLSNAIAAGGSVELYIALCNTYVEQNKLYDAVTMLDHVSDPAIKAQLDKLRPAAPVATPAPGFYSQYISVTVESAGGTLYVSCDGEYPSIQEDVYTDGISLSAGENTIYALSVAENGLVSPLSVFGYTVGGVIEEVKLADSALDALVRQMLNLGSDARILTSDLWTITELELPKATADLSDLQYCPYLTSLTMQECYATNLQLLSSLNYLTKLSITGTAVSAQDLSVIAALPNLTELTLSDCYLSSIRNLSGAQNLQYLDLSDNAIRDLSALSFMTNLQTLNLSRNALTNLSYLSSRTNLKILDVSYNSLASVVPLAGCTALEELTISHNSIGNLSGLESLKTLTKLDAGHNLLTEVDLLADLTGLRELILSDNTILDVASLSVLTNLQTFYISNNDIEALPQWDKSCALVYLNAAYNQLTDIRCLTDFAHLNTVVLDYNNLTNIDALATCHQMIRVDANGNPIEDISKLEDQSIIVYYTPMI